MEVNVHHAKTHLSKLIAAAESGEEVIIARNGKPAVKLVLVARAPKRPRILGAGVGEMIVPSWEEWKAMDEEITREMTESPLISGETLEATMQWLPQAMARDAEAKCMKDSKG
jgi:prevent-host-death family protein